MFIWIVRIHKLQLKFGMWKTYFFTQQLDIAFPSEIQDASPINNKLLIVYYGNLFRALLFSVLIKKKPEIFLTIKKNLDIILSKKLKPLFLLIYNIHIQSVFFLKFALKTCGV